MDENDFMISVLEEMDEDELRTYCDAIAQDVYTPKRKEDSHE